MRSTTSCNTVARAGFAALFIAGISAHAAIVLERAQGEKETFATVQSAIDAASPGDTVRLAAGVYHENILFPRSGRIDAPITLEGAGPSTIIDGADPSFQQTSSSSTPRWTPVKEGDFTGYRAEAPISGITIPGVNTWISRFDTPGNHGCDRLIAAYASLAALQANPRREGSFRDSEHVYIRLIDDEDPNTVGLNIGRAPAVLDLAGNSHIRIRSLDLRNGGAVGIRLHGDTPYSHVEISDLTIRNCWRAIISRAQTPTGSHVLISRVRILNGVPDGWEWHGAYTNDVGTYTKARYEGPWQGVGLQLENLEDSEIRDCLILGQFDGMAIRGNRIRIHHNTFDDIMDDGIELETRSSAHIEFFNNHIRGAKTGISVTSNTPGPVYVYRNVCETTRFQAVWYPVIKDYSYSIKSGTDFARKAENVKFYHNTLYSHGGNVWELVVDEARDRWHGYDFINNIFYSDADAPGRRSPKNNVTFRGAGEQDDGGDNHWEANLYNLDTPAGEKDALTDAELEHQFVRARPGAAPFDKRDLRLRPGASGKNSGSDYPAQEGWPDSVETWPAGRDRGAWEDGMADGDIGAPPDLLAQPLRLADPESFETSAATPASARSSRPGPLS